MAQRHGPGLILVMILVGLGGGRLAGQEAASPVAAGQPAPAAEEQPRDWQRQLDAIADLLIDGEAGAAEERANALLATPDLPAAVAARAGELRQKAETRRSAAASSPPAPAPAGDREATAPGAAVTGASFKVRLALVGRGFEQGTSGILRLNDRGIDFVPAGRKRAGWTLAWSDLAEARLDDGLWDIPDRPLVLVERSGRKRYLARLDASGRFNPSGPLLVAIQAGRSRETSADRTPPP